MRTYFFDTYALFEIVMGNPSYRTYTECIVVTTKLNLLELHYGLSKRHGKEVADRYYDRFKIHVVEVEDQDFKRASAMRIKNRKLSYVDCIGYAIARRMGIQFLTGDREFEGAEAVEYVK